MKEPETSFWCVYGRLVLFAPYFFRMHFNKDQKLQKNHSFEDEQYKMLVHRALGKAASSGKKMTDFC